MQILNNGGLLRRAKDGKMLHRKKSKAEKKIDALVELAKGKCDGTTVFSVLREQFGASWDEAVVVARKMIAKNFI